MSGPTGRALRDLDHRITATLAGPQRNAIRLRRAALALAVINAAGTTLPGPSTSRVVEQASRDVADAVTAILTAR